MRAAHTCKACTYGKRTLHGTLRTQQTVDYGHFVPPGVMLNTGTSADSNVGRGIPPGFRPSHGDDLRFAHLGTLSSNIRKPQARCLIDRGSL